MPSNELLATLPQRVMLLQITSRMKLAACKTLASANAREGRGPCRSVRGCQGLDLTVTSTLYILPGDLLGLLERVSWQPN